MLGFGIFLAVIATLVLWEELALFLKYWFTAQYEREPDAINPIKELRRIIGFILLNLAFMALYDGTVGLGSTVRFQEGLERQSLVRIAYLSIKEEVLFRGIGLFIGFVVLKWLKVDIGYLLGIITSTVFGALHYFNFDQPKLVYIVPYIFAGMVFWFVAKRTSLGQSIALHVSHNLFLRLLATL